MVRGVIFDCFGVLYSGSLQHLYELTPPHRHGELRDLCHASDYGFIGRSDYVAGLAGLTGRSAGDIEHIISVAHIRDDRMFGLLAGLRPQYKTGLLSNVGQGAIKRLFEPAELELFDSITLSSDEGLAKPTPGIFELAAARLGAEPGECVMIDDSPANCEGAVQTGMRAIRHITYIGTARQLSEIMEEAARA